MTDYQRKKVRELRMSGVGYKSIASSVGLTRDVVRNYCKTNDLVGNGTALNINIDEQIQNGDACPYCGKEIIQPPTGRRKKFCSDECRRSWWKAHPELIQKNEQAVYIKTCAYCGNEFKSYGKKDRKYCSHECYILDRFDGEDK